MIDVLTSELRLGGSTAGDQGQTDNFFGKAAGAGNVLCAEHERDFRKSGKIDPS